MVKIQGKVKFEDILNKTLKAIFWAILAYHHYNVQAHKFVVIIMALIVIDCLHDAIFLLTHYLKQRRKIDGPSDLNNE